MNVLVIRSSARGSASVSGGLVDRLTARLTAAGNTIVTRDLDQDPIPHVRASSLSGIGREAPEGPDAGPTHKLSTQLIDEVLAADLIVIGAPMYNFSIASTLKSWFDHVLRAGRTFQYGAAGAEGLVTGKRAVVLVSRAGAYPGGSESVDFQVPYVRTLLGFIGITDVTFIVAEGLAYGADAAAASIAAANAAVDAFADSAA